jgi:hypothetical protein
MLYTGGYFVRYSRKAYHDHLKVLIFLIVYLSIVFIVLFSSEYLNDITQGRVKHLNQLPKSEIFGLLSMISAVLLMSILMICQLAVQKGRVIFCADLTDILMLCVF